MDGSPPPPPFFRWQPGLCGAPLICFLYIPRLLSDWVHGPLPCAVWNVKDSTQHRSSRSSRSRLSVHLIQSRKFGSSFVLLLLKIIESSFPSNVMVIHDSCRQFGSGANFRIPNIEQGLFFLELCKNLLQRFLKNSHNVRQIRK